MNKALKIVLFFSFIVGIIGCKSTPETKKEQEPQSELQSEPIKEPQSELDEDKETEKQKKEQEQFLAEIKKLREKALSLHADTAYPDLFKIADETAEAARTAYVSKEFDRAKEKAQQALLQYRTLINKMHIDAAKLKIDEHHLVDYDAETYQKAGELLTQIEDSYIADPQKSYELSLEALKTYEKIRNLGFKLLSEEAKKKADEARAACDSIKAIRSSKDLYEKAVLSYRQADAFSNDENFEQAYMQYTGAADTFMHIYEIVEAKRVAATEAIEKARQRQEASTKLAQDADSEVPLPEHMEGFSDEPLDLDALKLLDEKIDGSSSETHAADSTLSIDDTNSGNINSKKVDVLNSVNNEEPTVHEESSKPEKGDS